MSLRVTSFKLDYHKMSILDIKLPGGLLFMWRAPLELVSNSMREGMTNNDMDGIAYDSRAEQTIPPITAAYASMGLKTLDGRVCESPKRQK